MEGSAVTQSRRWTPWYERPVDPKRAWLYALLWSGAFIGFLAVSGGSAFLTGLAVGCLIVASGWLGRGLRSRFRTCRSPTNRPRPPPSRPRPTLAGSPLP